MPEGPVIVALQERNDGRCEFGSWSRRRCRRAAVWEARDREGGLGGYWCDRHVVLFHVPPGKFVVRRLEAAVEAGTQPGAAIP